MTTDRVFVLLMMVLLMMAGCFEATSTTEAQEEQDSTSGDDDSTDSSTLNGGNTVTNFQQRVWYSSGGTYNNYWNDGQDINEGYNERCIDYGPTYDSSTGEYIGEGCRETAIPSEESHWNTSMCTDNGGTIIWDGYNYESDYRYAPNCLHVFKTINTTAGEALLVYQASGFLMKSTCNGMTPTTYANSGTYGSSLYSVTKEYKIVPNSAFDCTHELYRSISFENYEISEYLWSIVYAVQDTVVV